MTTLTLVNGCIPWNTVDLLMRATRSIWLATTRPDGRPHAVPVWFVWDGRSAYFINERSLQKGRNLRHQSWVVLHLGDGDDVVIAEGPATVVTDPAERQRVAQQYGDKYVEPQTGERASIYGPGVDLHRVTVEHVMAWVYGNVATRTDWRAPPRTGS